MQDLFKKKNVCQYKQQLVIGFIAPKDKCYSGDLKQVIVIHNSSDYVHYCGRNFSQVYARLSPAYDCRFDSGSAHIRRAFCYCSYSYCGYVWRC